MNSISLPFVDGLEETTKEGSPQLGLATVELKPISPFWSAYVFCSISDPSRQVSVFFFRNEFRVGYRWTTIFIVWIYIEMCYTIAMQYWIGPSRTCGWKDWRWYIEIPLNLPVNYEYQLQWNIFTNMKMPKKPTAQQIVAIRVSIAILGFTTIHRGTLDEVLGRANSSFTALTYLPQETLQQRWPLNSMAEVKVRDSEGVSWQLLSWGCRTWRFFEKFGTHWGEWKFGSKFW